MDPVTATILAAAVQAMIGGGIAAATPKHGMSQPGTPQSHGGQEPMDFSQLVGGGQGSNLTKLQLENRLPRQN